MNRIQDLIVLHPVITFLLLTLFISLVSFGLMWIVPRAQSPESFPGLPIWMIAIWSPNLAALLVWSMRKELFSQLKVAFSAPEVSIWSGLVLVPIGVALLLFLYHIYQGHTIEWRNFKLSYLLPLILINLIMGPLGEELGWRGFLYPSIKSELGWLWAAIIVGVIWALWHAPLWLIDSPQSKIPFWAFFLTVLCLSLLMSVVYDHGGKSIVLIVLFHLLFNVSLGVVDILETHESGDFIVQSLYIYIPLTLVVVIWQVMNTVKMEI